MRETAIAIMLSKSTFLHIPKCGGSWVVHAMAAAGLSPQTIPVGAQHAIAATGGRFVFTFVRHPLTWYQSFWKYRWNVAEMQGAGIDDSLRKCARRADEPIDSCLVDDAGCPRSFADFVKECVARHPGFVSKKFAIYASKADFVGRQESLCEDLLSALCQAGEVFDPAAIRGMARVNESSGKLGADYPAGLADQVLATESAAIEAFYGRQRPSASGLAA